MVAVLDPVNKFDFRLSTLGKGEFPTTPIHNKEERFDHPVFTKKNSKGEI